MTNLFADVKKQEAFYAGYYQLTSTKITTNAFFIGFVDRVSKYFVSPQSVVETLVRLANVVFDETPVTWDMLSDIYRFLSTMRGSKIYGHEEIVKKLNVIIGTYGIQLDI